MASSHVLPLLDLVRAESMDMQNDPRMFANNVLMARLGAFHVISVCAVLMGNLCCTQMLKLEGHFESPVQYFAFVTLAACFILNLFAVIVIVQQLFHLHRLSTAGATGFETAKSYYLNKNIVTLRHMAARMFFFCIPVFLVCLACSVYVKLGDQKRRSIPVCILLLASAIVLLAVNIKSRNIFTEKYNIAKAHELPLLNHLQEVSMRHTTLNIEPGAA